MLLPNTYGKKEFNPAYRVDKAVAYGKSPWFYLDCAEYFFQLGRREQGLQILSNIAELDLRDDMYLMILGRCLDRFGFPRLSVDVYHQVARFNPGNPIAIYERALVLARLGRYKRAINDFYKVAQTEWRGYPHIRVQALTELNRLVKKAGLTEAETAQLGIDKRLVHLLDADIRIVLSWNNRNADLNLWLDEPGGELVSSASPISRIGGSLTAHIYRERCEEYMIRKKVPGKYAVIIEDRHNGNGYGNGPVLIRLDIFTDYGRDKETCKTKWLWLRDTKPFVPVEVVTF